MKEIVSVGIGLFVASIIPPAIFSIVGALDGQWRLSAIIGTIFITYPFSLLFVLMLGLPTFLALRPYGPGHWWSVAIVGLILGVVVGITLRLPGPPDFRDVPTTGALGVASALAFWMIWRWGAYGGAR